MSLTVGNRILETTSTSGTGNITLAGAAAGYKSFGNTIGSGNTTYYTVVDGNNWEIGYGTLANSTTLVRNVIQSTNSNAAISLAGTGAQVFCDMPAGFFNSPELLGNLDVQTFRVFTGNTTTWATQYGYGADLVMPNQIIIGDATSNFDFPNGFWQPTGVAFKNKYNLDMTSDPSITQTSYANEVTYTTAETYGAWNAGTVNNFLLNLNGQYVPDSTQFGVQGLTVVSNPTATDSSLYLLIGGETAIVDNGNGTAGLAGNIFAMTANVTIGEVVISKSRARFNNAQTSIYDLYMHKNQWSLGGIGSITNQYSFSDTNPQAILQNYGPIVTQSAITMQGQGTPGQDLTVTGGNVIVTMDGGGNGGTIFSQGSPVTRFVAVPTSSIGASTDMPGDIAANTSHTYICIQPYNGSTNIWRRTANDGTTW